MDPKKSDFFAVAEVWPTEKNDFFFAKDTIGQDNFGAPRIGAFLVDDLARGSGRDPRKRPPLKAGIHAAELG